MRRVNDHIEDTLRWEKPASGDRPSVLGFWSYRVSLPSGESCICMCRHVASGGPPIPGC